MMVIDDGPVEVLWQDGERLYRRIWRDMGDGNRRELLVAQSCAEHPGVTTFAILPKDVQAHLFSSATQCVRVVAVIHTH